MSIASEGQRVDNFYTHKPKPVSQSVLQSLKTVFDYLECQGCGRILQTARLSEKDIENWKFDLMGLRPTILKVARATCPLCQELEKQFSSVFRKE